MYILSSKWGYWHDLRLFDFQAYICVTSVFYQF